MPNNLYLLSTATSIENSGTGTNVLTKPAGVESASIVPGRKYSVYIPTAATFSTNFNSDVDSFYLYFYAKPNPGIVLNIAGTEILYTGTSFVLVNGVGDKVEIPERSPRAHLFLFTMSDMEMGFFVDGTGNTIPADTTDTVGQLSVSLLGSGGLLDYVVASKGQLSNAERDMLISKYRTFHAPAYDTIMMYDTSRDMVFTKEVVGTLYVPPGGVHEIPLEASECESFKLEYEVTGYASVSLNGMLAYSGISLAETPDRVVITTGTGCTISNMIITEYVRVDMDTVNSASVATTLSSGTPAPTHTHDDNYGNRGSTTVEFSDPAGTVSGWFRAQNGALLPGVSMNNGVLTGTGLYVNGKPYSDGDVVHDWFFLSSPTPTTGTFTITVPVHSLTVSEAALSASEIDDLYESFFGNQVYTGQESTLKVSGGTAALVSTEWSIVTSG